MKRQRAGIPILFFLLLLVLPLNSQESGESGRDLVPDGYREIKLGMDLELVKNLLQKDPYFLFRGDPDVSMLERPNTTLIECRGSYHIDRAFFQFYQEKLYIIILLLNPEPLDHYAVYTALLEKYGKPVFFSPKNITWGGPEVELSLERPLTVKYIDLKVFEEINSQRGTEEAHLEVLREDFLKQF